MLRFVIIGRDELVHRYIRLIHSKSSMKIIAILDKEPTTETKAIANEFEIEIVSTYGADLHKQANYVIYPNEKGEFLAGLSESIDIDQFFHNREALVLNDLVVTSTINQKYLQLVCHNLEAGLIVIDDQEIIRYINYTTTKLLGKSFEDLIGKKIKSIMPDSRLPTILETRTKELQSSARLNNETEVISSRYPIINQENHLEGAYELIQVKDTAIDLVKQHTDYNKLKVMVTTLINNTTEAISFVDESGYLKMCNQQYASLAKSLKSDLIGHEATLGVFEGNRVHLDVLRTRRTLKGVKMTVNAKLFQVNALPIIIEGKFRGSIAIYNDVTKLNNIADDLKVARQIIRRVEMTYLFEDIIYQNSQMNLVMEQAKFAADTQMPILLIGDKGTGKALLANAIHNESNRKYNRYIQLSRSSDYYETIKKIKRTNDGTLFIDEIEFLDLSTQKELLKVMKNKSSFNLRIIASTKIDLEQAVKENKFSQELLKEISSLTLSLPTLNNRKADLDDLIHHFINDVNQRYDMKITSLSNAALEVLTDYTWPGNINELANVIEHAAIMMNSEDHLIDVNHLATINNNKIEQTEITKPLQEVMDEYERKHIKSVYELQKYNKTKTAKILGISVRNLYYKIDKYRLDES